MRHKPSLSQQAASGSRGGFVTSGFLTSMAGMYLALWGACFVVRVIFCLPFLRNKAAQYRLI